MIRVNYSYTPQRCHSFLHILLAVVFRSEANYHLLERRQIPQAQLEISDAASYFSRLAHSHTGNVRSRSVSLGMAPCQNTTGGAIPQLALYQAWERGCTRNESPKDSSLLMVHRQI